MNERAVSEVLGYILIFGVVMSVISFVYLQVYQSIVETSQKFKIEGIRESFRKIYNVFILSVYGGANLQQIQIELQGGTLSVENSTHISVKIGNESYYFYTKSLNYQLGNYRISFENGALWESYYGYNRSVQTPSIYIKNVQVPQASGVDWVFVIVLNQIEGDIAVSGEGSVVILFNSSLLTSGLYKDRDVVLEINSPFAELWEEYLNRFGDVIRENNTVRFTKHADTLILTVYKTEVTTKNI
uniref:Uncharacterized protein n=1 Tax=Archaeoglobus fulgidus TaxID=2234 RepID=A0A7J2TI68_ARCFL